MLDKHSSVCARFQNSLNKSLELEQYSGTYFKLLLWFTNSTPAGIPSFNSPREAIRWIVLNKPSSVSGSYGGDGGGSFLGYDNYTASVKFNS